MRKKYFVKGAGALVIIIILLLTSTAITADKIAVKNKTIPVEKLLLNEEEKTTANRDVLFQDDFESYTDFVIDFPPWTNVDVDGAPSFGSSTNDWPNEGLPQAFIIFNPSMTTPPWTDPLIQPHSGAKFAGCFNANNAGYISNDWLITPLLGPADYDEVIFWAKSFNNQYNLEHFQVGISTTDTNPTSFTIITPSPYVVAPYEQWNLYSYTLDDYDNQAIYIGIHMMSTDSWLFMVDDFQVTFTEQNPEPAICCQGNLDWVDVPAGATVTGYFEVCNCGEDGSLLNWEVMSWPDWGEGWTFEPASGTGLAAGDCVTINVTVTAPSEKNQQFGGRVVMRNSDNEEDTCIVDVNLNTPRPRFINSPFLLRILERFDNVFAILKLLF